MGESIGRAYKEEFISPVPGTDLSQFIQLEEGSEHHPLVANQLIMNWPVEFRVGRLFTGSFLGRDSLHGEIVDCH